MKPYGMPHIWASYKGGIRKTKADEGACCVLCGRPMPNVHHEPPIGSIGIDTLRTKEGIYVLRPALICLCGSGTTGCHGKRHAGKLRIEWRWDTEAAARDWYSGELLRHMRPHDPRLFRLGCYVFTDESGERTEVRL